ncbi:MAG: hypothetical protein ABJ364_08485, partial [Lentilitoribacter sp.]
LRSVADNLKRVLLWTYKRLKILCAWMTIAIVSLIALVWADFVRLDQICPAAVDACHSDGRIFVDSPEVYTRERLVNDRFLQDAWLRAQLRRLDEESFRETSILSQRSGFNVGGNVTEDLTRTLGNGASVNGNGLDDALGTPVALAFSQRAAQREVIRQMIIENQLDDRHDLDGNTLYMLKFDVSVLPNSRAVAAFVEVELHPNNPPLPLKSFERSIPDYVDISFENGAQAHPQRVMYDRWL